MGAQGYNGSVKSSVDVVDAAAVLRPGRRIAGHAAVLLPHRLTGEVDWASFEELLTRTAAAGLTAAVNMDTGFVQLLDSATRAEVLAVTARIAGPGFLAGAYVADLPGDRFAADKYAAAMDEIAAQGGVPVIFPSHGLNALDPAAWVAAHERFGDRSGRFIAFELGTMFVPYGRIYPLEAYRGLLGIAACAGAKHSSLSRQAEWNRLALRDELRPEFSVLTGNDLAIDMVCYGSDYLLGLAAFAPDLFARRDALWEAGDPAFAELNAALQRLGAFAFRDPVPAYRHDAAMWLKLRGWITSDAVAPGAPMRPDADRQVLRELVAALGAFS
jgi:dihydrodipicolinate synthase/N-acetylneuraminate lyase